MKKLLISLGIGVFAATFFACLPVAVEAATLVTNGSSEIGSFPIAESELPNTSWRIDTAVTDAAVVTSTPFDFAGPSNTTLSNPTGWTRAINDDMDDDYVRIPFGFEVNFNGTAYSDVFIGSNTYFTFGEGDSQYSDLAADVPPLPGVHICSDDNSYQRVYYRFDDANTLRVRYEGTDSTGGTIGEPTIVYEVVYYAGESYHDLYIGINESCSGDSGPGVTALGNGYDGDYSLPATSPGSTEYDRGDFYADSIDFSEELDAASQAAVEAAITAGASYPPRFYEWVGSTLYINATTSVTFYDDVLSAVTSTDSDFAARLLLIDADDVAPEVDYLGDGSTTYTLPSTCPSVACDRGDIYGASLTFTEDLSAGSKLGVEAAITAGASVAPRVFVWRDNVLRIYATTTVLFYGDVYADLSDALGNTATHQRLIDSVPTPQTEIWVDDDYTELSCGGHNWQENAFDNFGDAFDTIAEGGVIHVLAGDYEDDSFTIDKNGVSIIGPTSGSPARFSDDCSDVFTIDDASGVTISNLTIYQTDGGSIDDSYCYDNPVVRVGWDSASTTLSNNIIAGGYIGVALRYDSMDNTLTDNNINNNSWAGIVDLGFGVQTITGNTLEYNDRGLSLGAGPDRDEQQDLEGSEISGNIIRENSNVGIYYISGDQPGPVNIGPDNEIYNNGDGIYIDGPAYDVHINGNQIYDNVLITSGLHVEYADTGLDATENWWGDASGPYEVNAHPLGTGDTIYIDENSDYVYYRPYCLDEDCIALSSVTADPDNIADLLQNGGSITPILTSPDDGDPSTYLVDSLEVNEDVIIEIPGSGGTQVTLPAGTIITKTDGGTFDANDLSAAEVALGSLSGFTAGTVVEGALQWGVPSLGLSFSQPITISIFVGTDLNGQTLSVVRSSNMNSGWTDTGIVDPASCVVTLGLCTFQATMASYYSATSYSSSGGGSGGGGGSYMAPAAIGDGLITANIQMGGSANIGRIGTKGVNILHYVNSIANFETYESGNGGYGQHMFTITELDMVNKKYTFRIQSEPQTLTLNLGESVSVDLDGDAVNDISIKFTNLYVNRIETTIKQLSPAAAQAEDTESDGTFVVSVLADFISINNIVRNSALEKTIMEQIQADAKEFGLTLENIASIVDYVAYGNSQASLKFGSGERRAIMRDYMETVNHAIISWDDVERLAIGQIPKVRNLANEQKNVAKALPVFRKIFGHDPNFQVEKENLAWNTLMYRIRFTRDLAKEAPGITAYRKLYGHDPITPFSWSVVRVLGYVK